jgi:hypothetical protein
MEHRWNVEFAKPPVSLPDRVVSPGQPAKHIHAKRIHYDFTVFLIVVSPAIGLTTFRRRASWRCKGLPAPGIAASAAAALAVTHQVVERAWTVFSSRSGELIWALRIGEHWSPYEWGYGVSVFQVAAGVTGAILGVWSYLLLARAWKPRDDWRDLLGRWLAWSWFSVLLFEVLAPAL